MQGGLNSKMFEVALKANRGARLKYATSVRKATVDATAANIHSSKTQSLAEPTPPLEGLYSGTRADHYGICRKRLFLPPSLHGRAH